MTEKQILRLFEAWKHRLGLDLWHIEVRVEDPEDMPTALFQVRRSTTYNRAVISIPPWVVRGGPRPEGIIDVTITDEFIETGIVHELLHCVRQHSHGLIMDQLEGQLHRDVYTAVTGSYVAALELEIENLAEALVRAWPGQRTS